MFFQISGDIEKLYQLVTIYYFTIGEKYKESHSVDDELLSEMMEAQMGFSVRGQRYQIFEHDYYRGLLEPHNDIFIKLFNISDDEIIDGIDKLQYALSQGRMDPITDLMDMFEEFRNADENDAFLIIESQKEKSQELISQSFGVELNDVCKVTGWKKDFVEALSSMMKNTLDGLLLIYRFKRDRSLKLTKTIIVSIITLFLITFTEQSRRLFHV